MIVYIVPIGLGGALTCCSLVVSLVVFVPCPQTSLSVIALGLDLVFALILVLDVVFLLGHDIGLGSTLVLGFALCIGLTLMLGIAVCSWSSA